MEILLIDIETAPAKAFIWDLKTRYVPLSQIAEDGHVLCFAAGWYGSDELEFYSKWDDGEEEMVKMAWELLDEADAVIHYNGNSFDIPRLNAEFLKYRLGPPSPAHQIDLYRTVTRKFKVLSKSMNHLLTILGLDKKLEHKGMALWTGCMAGLKEDQDIMEAYNIQDVIALEDLYKELLPWIPNHPNWGVFIDAEDPTCRNCGSTNVVKNGIEYKVTLPYQRYKCADCGNHMRARRRLKPAQDGVLV